jgi:hypothetical protein
MEPIKIQDEDGNIFWTLLDMHAVYGKQFHRIDGPAIEWASADENAKHWYLNDKRYTFEDWKIAVRKYYDTQEDYLLMLLKLD